MYASYRGGLTGRVLTSERVAWPDFATRPGPRRPRRMALRKALKEFMEIPPCGDVAEWLRSGLQNRLPRFNSGRRLQPLDMSSYWLRRTGAAAASPGHPGPVREETPTSSVITTPLV